MDKRVLKKSSQEGALAHDRTPRLELVGSLFQSTMELFRAALQSVNKREDLRHYQESLQRSFGALFFFGYDLGATLGELDKALEQARDIRNVVLSVLIAMAEVISQGLLQHALHDKQERDTLLHKFNIRGLIDRARYVADELQEDTATEDVESMEDISKDLQAYTEGLTSLTYSIQHPAKEIEYST